MPTLKVKTLYIDKLKALGVYDKWLANVKSDKHDIYHMDTMYERSDNFNQFINNSFSWHYTPEDYNYWADISNK